MIVNVNDYIINELNKSLYEIDDEGHIIINDQKVANIISNYITQYDSFHTDTVFDGIVFEGVDIHIGGIIYNLIVKAVHFTDCNISCDSIYDSMFKYVSLENCTIDNTCLVDCYMQYCGIDKSKASIVINHSNINHFTIKDSYVCDSELHTSSVSKFDIKNSIVCDSELVDNTVSDKYIGAGTNAGFASCGASLPYAWQEKRDFPRIIWSFMRRMRRRHSSTCSIQMPFSQRRAVSAGAFPKRWKRLKRQE